MMTTTVSVSEARASMPELLTRVQGGDEVTITRHGRPVAVLVDPAKLRGRRAQLALDGAAKVHDLLADATVGDAAGLTPGRAEELIREIRAGRDAG